MKAARALGTPPVLPAPGRHPHVTVMKAQRLDAVGPARAFTVKLWLSETCRPEVRLTVDPRTGPAVELPGGWPDASRWAPAIVAAIRASWPLLLAGEPPPATPPVSAGPGMAAVRGRPRRPRR